MDRTKASDAFNAGSIPVGRTLHHLDYFMWYFRRDRPQLQRESRSMDSFVLIMEGYQYD